MGQQLQQITISAPGFYGINTQDSPIGANPNFASVADNCVIDQTGRIGARKGFQYVSSNGSSVLGTSAGIEAVHEHTKNDGSLITFSAGNNKIFSGTTTLTDITPALYTITANNWKIVSFNSCCYFFQRGYEPLVWQNDGTFTKMSSVAGALGTPPQGNEVLAAYGRLFVADLTGNKSTVYWSDLLLGAQWTGGSSGSINVTKFWPTGYDEITGLAAHNGFLIIFGKRSILLYSGADTPSTMVLHDTIESIGCVSRDTVQHTGTDLIFLSESGVRSLMRTVQEKSAPMRDISKNVRTDLQALYSVETGKMKSVYSPEEAFYLLTFPVSSAVYCFDLRSPLEDMAFRATTWSGIAPLCFARTSTGLLYMGHPLGISKYTGYLDNASTYQMRYFSNPLDFGNASNLKFLKKFALTIIGGQGLQTVLNWAYDYSGSYRKQSFSLGGATQAYYGSGEYGVAEYAVGVVANRPQVSGSGSGFAVTVGVEVTINGKSFSIQKMDILALIGRIV